jgi:type I restriction enzyme, S subunit
MSIELAPTILGAPVRRWKRYPAYRDSRVEWIGEVPEGWRFTRLKYTLKEKLKYGANESAELDDTNLPRYIRITDFWDNGKLKNDTFKSLPFEVAKDYILQHGDVLFARSGATVGKTFQFKNYDGLACFAGYLIKATPNQKIILSDYLYFLTKSNMYDNWKNNTFIQATIQNIGADKYSLLPMFLPNIDEQRAIAAFIDLETGRIDALIEKKEQQVELLQEKRAALISHAVTKELDPDVKMKDSGVEWLGEVPEHWNIGRAKLLFQEINDRSTSGEETLLTVSHITGVTRRSEKNVNMFMAESLEGYKICEAGDLVINTMWAWMGAMGIAPERGIVSPSYNVYRLRTQENEPSFYDYLFRTEQFVSEVICHSKGIWSSCLRLYPESFFEIQIPFSPQEEQRGIVYLIQKETGNYKTFQRKIEKSIEKLREYRTALISAAVTGKIDVRGDFVS